MKTKPTTDSGTPEAFIARHGAAITGVLSGFDRLRFRRTLRTLQSVRGMMGYFSRVHAHLIVSLCTDMTVTNPFPGVICLRTPLLSGRAFTNESSSTRAEPQVNHLTGRYDCIGSSGDRWGVGTVMAQPVRSACVKITSATIAQSLSVEQALVIRLFAFFAAFCSNSNRMTLLVFDDKPNAELSPDLAEVKARHERYLRRGLARVDDRFEHYVHGLRARKERDHREKSIGRYQPRIGVTHAQHRRCRGDQIERHVMRGIPHLDVLLVIGEAAFRTVVESRAAGKAKSAGALFPPRARRWSFATEG